ncbi:hypothetical protein OQA88_7881 [Cercophora sp. LCS_1]
MNEAKLTVGLDGSAMQQLQTEQRALLDTIDELRGLGLGKYVDLPQLIVVGDQSAGKSSVLEAISRVRFPIKDGVCTRFATELALRRSPQTKIEVGIQNNAAHEDFKRSGFNKDDLPRIIEEAKQQMGIGGDSTGFSQDVLRIEIAGPNVPQLTLVDLPGFFHNETETQGIDGMKIVDGLAEKYMGQENSIILAVISAQNELAAQKVLREARKHDPSRTRTLGILTKPDKVEPESDNERTYLRLAQNEEASHKLALGWHILRNRAPKEMSSADTERDEREKDFFRTGVWAEVSPRSRGIEPLRERLSQVLLNHIQRKLPGLVTNIEDHIKTRQTKLEALGEPRSSTDDMKKYLINVSGRFQRVARDAIHGVYTDNFFGGLYLGTETAFEDRRVKKFRALVRDLNRAFHFVLTTKGGRRVIRWDDDSGVDEAASAPRHLEPLISLYTVDQRIEIAARDLVTELDKAASENQGVELPGSPNDRVTLALFRDHSKPWEAIASQHVELVADFSRIFVESLVAHLVGPDRKTADAVIRDVVHPFFEEKRVTLQSKVTELLRHYKTGSDPQPIHSIFLKGVERRRNERITKQVARLVEQNPGLFAGGKFASGVDYKDLALKVLKASSNVSSEFNAEQTIDSAMFYYDMSLRVFTDNVITLALENCLISDIPDILSPEKVFDMSDDKITALAVESEAIRTERKQLQSQLDKLQKGLSACHKYRPRESIAFRSKPSGTFSVAGAQTVSPKDKQAEKTSTTTVPTFASNLRTGNPGATSSLFSPFSAFNSNPSVPLFRTPQSETPARNPFAGPFFSLNPTPTGPSVFSTPKAETSAGASSLFSGQGLLFASTTTSSKKTNGSR